MSCYNQELERIDELEKEIDRLSTQLAEARNDYDEACADAMDVVRKLAKAQEMNEALHTTNRELGRRLDKSQEREKVLMDTLERIHAEAQVPDDTTSKEDVENVCGYILNMSHEALNKDQKC